MYPPCLPLRQRTAVASAEGDFREDDGLRADGGDLHAAGGVLHAAGGFSFFFQRVVRSNPGVVLTFQVLTVQ